MLLPKFPHHHHWWLLPSGGGRGAGSRQGRQRGLPLRGPAVQVQSPPAAQTPPINLILCNLDTYNYDTKSH